MSLDKRCKPCTDHLGNDFPSTVAMCEHWGVTDSEFRGRLKSGWTLEQALTGNRARMGKACTDHLGNEFGSIAAMCKHWGVSPAAFNGRLRRGETLEQALAGAHSAFNSKPCTDHLGQRFPSQKAMFRHWNVTEPAFRYRIKHGWTVEEALAGGCSPSDA